MITGDDLRRAWEEAKAGNQEDSRWEEDGLDKKSLQEQIEALFEEVPTLEVYPKVGIFLAGFKLGVDAVNKANQIKDLEELL